MKLAQQCQTFGMFSQPLLHISVVLSHLIISHFYHLFISFLSNLFISFFKSDIFQLDQLTKQMSMSHSEINGVKVVKLGAEDHDETKHVDTDPSNKGKGQ